MVIIRIQYHSHFCFHTSGLPRRYKITSGHVTQMSLLILVTKDARVLLYYLFFLHFAKFFSKASIEKWFGVFYSLHSEIRELESKIFKDHKRFSFQITSATIAV